MNTKYPSGFMKLFRILSCVCFLAVVEAGENTFNYVDADTWLAGVHKARNHITGLYKYDPLLLREYFAQYGETTSTDLNTKLNGLAAFGFERDKQEVLRLAKLHQTKEVDGGQDWACAFLMDMKRRNAYYKYIIPARYGDVAALKHLLINTNREEVVCLLAKTQTGLARDNLAMIARDNKWPGIAKLWAVEALVMSGDQRGINILLSDEMLQIIEASHSELGYSQAGWWLFDGVGKPQGYVSGSFDTPAKARAWLKEHPEAIVFPRKKISVKGGIDWSKVDWTTSPPRLKQE